MLSAVTFILLQGKVAVVTVLWTVHSIPDTVGVILPNAALSRRACEIALLKQQKKFFLNKKEERKNKKAVKSVGVRLEGEEEVRIEKEERNRRLNNQQVREKVLIINPQKNANKKQ